MQKKLLMLTIVGLFNYKLCQAYIWKIYNKTGKDLKQLIVSVQGYKFLDGRKIVISKIIKKDIPKDKFVEFKFEDDYENSRLNYISYGGDSISGSHLKPRNCSSGTIILYEKVMPSGYNMLIAEAVLTKEELKAKKAKEILKLLKFKMR